MCKEIPFLLKLEYGHLPAIAKAHSQIVWSPSSTWILLSWDCIPASIFQFLFEFPWAVQPLDSVSTWDIISVQCSLQFFVKLLTIFGSDIAIFKLLFRDLDLTSAKASSMAGGFILLQTCCSIVVWYWRGNKNGLLLFYNLIIRGALHASSYCARES